MKVLIIYSTRAGATREAADRLAEAMRNPDVDVTTSDIKSRPVLDDVDMVILGASIRAGSIAGEMKAFCRKYVDSLLAKRLAIFVSSMSTGERARSYVEQNFPVELLAHSELNIGVGGRVDMERLGPVTRFILSKAARIRENKVTFDDSAFEALAALPLG